MMGKLDDRRVKDLENALEGILQTVALDWYVQHFARDGTPIGVNTGIAAKIHNTETTERIKIAFENGRKALAAWREEK